MEWVSEWARGIWKNLLHINKLAVPILLQSCHNRIQYILHCCNLHPILPPFLVIHHRYSTLWATMTSMNVKTCHEFLVKSILIFFLGTKNAPNSAQIQLLSQCHTHLSWLLYNHPGYFPFSHLCRIIICSPSREEQIKITPQAHTHKRKKSNFST